MKIAIFSSKPHDRKFLSEANVDGDHELVFLEAQLDSRTVALARGFITVSAFVNDHFDRVVLTALAEGGTRLVALRCAGFNNVDTAAAAELGITIVRVPAYSPHAVAEHAVGMILTLNRKFHRAHNRVREGNFSLDGLLGFDLLGRTVGIVGTGRIGEAFGRIMVGFGCRVLGFDPTPNPTCVGYGLEYVSLDVLFRQSDIISLHCPLTPGTRHIINPESIGSMKPGVMLINTGRGALVDTPAMVAALKQQKVGYFGLDVYEEEEELFSRDLSNTIIQDDVFMRLVTFPNVLITAHQGFFTEEALRAIAKITLSNISAFENGNIAGLLGRVGG